MTGFEEDGEWVPSPEEIRERSAEIQASWTWEERLMRLAGEGVIDFERVQAVDGIEADSKDGPIVPEIPSRV